MVQRLSALRHRLTGDPTSGGFVLVMLLVLADIVRRHFLDD